MSDLPDLGAIVMAVFLVGLLYSPLWVSRLIDWLDERDKKRRP